MENLDANKKIKFIQTEIDFLIKLNQKSKDEEPITPYLFDCEYEIVDDKFNMNLYLEPLKEDINDENFLHFLKFKTFKERLQVYINLFNILKKLHDKNIKHCDLKVANIMLDFDYKFRFIDFGGSAIMGDKCLVKTKYYRAPNRSDTKCL